MADSAEHLTGIAAFDLAVRVRFRVRVRVRVRTGIG
jgi:hypothetical protein